MKNRFVFSAIAFYGFRMIFLSIPIMNFFMAYKLKSFCCTYIFIRNFNIVIGTEIFVLELLDHVVKNTEDFHC